MPLPSTEKILNHLHEEVQENLDNYGASWWTSSVKKWVVDSLKLPNTVAHTKHGSMKGGWSPEYLVDVAVSRDTKPPAGNPNDPFSYTGLILAVESEWSPDRDDRAYDFCKLADVRACRKIFVGGVRSRDWSSVGKNVISKMTKFWNLHKGVLPGEEVGVLLMEYGANNSISAWVITKGRKVADRVILRKKRKKKTQ